MPVTNNAKGATDSVAPLRIIEALDPERFEAHVAWAAGIFEGEGYIGLRQQRPSASRPRRMYTALAVGLTDEDVLRRFCTVVGGGTVSSLQTPDHKAKVALGAKPAWIWNVSSLSEVTRITALLYPWLGERRQAKIVECLAADTRLA